MIGCLVITYLVILSVVTKGPCQPGGYGVPGGTKKYDHSGLKAARKAKGIRRLPPGGGGTMKLRLPPGMPRLALIGNPIFEI